MRRVAVVLLVAAAVAGCGGDDPDREAVEAYLERANEAQQQFEPGVRSAQAAIRSFAAGRAGPQVADRLRRAAATMRSARAALALVEPPPKARSLHEHQLQLLDLQAGLSHELSLAASYLPAAVDLLRPADDAGASLARALRSARHGAAQADALMRYVVRLDALLTRLDALGVPPVLAPWHAAQVGRLEASRELAAGLAAGIRRQDRSTLERALRAFSDEAPDRDVLQDAQAQAVRAFNRRLERQQRLLSTIFREHGALVLALDS